MPRESSAQTAEHTACQSCGGTDRPVARAVGVCVSCIRQKGKEALETAGCSHYKARKAFGLPESPPNEEGILCRICSQNCRIGEGQIGYCGLRWNDSGKLVSVSSPQAGLFWAYRDPHVTNCCAAFFCPAATGYGYPKFANTKTPEFGYSCLAIFLYGCNFDCLFCQNPTHKDVYTRSARPGDDLVEMTLQNDRISCWCFFGGSPEPQLPFAINASRKVLAVLNGKRIMRICFEWNGCGHPELVKRAARLAYESGGNVKFDLKTWDENLSLALSGVSNKVAYDNFELVAHAFKASPDHPPWLCATTLLVPGYVDEIEVTNIAKFIAAIDSAIPYSLLVFHPDFMMRDLPITPVAQVHRCHEAASKYLKRVHVGNAHLLRLEDREAFDCSN